MISISRLRNPRLLAIAGLGVACALPVKAQGDAPFLRGDVNADGTLSISDVVMIERWLFSGGPLECRNAADVDDSGRVDLSDSITLILYLFLGRDGGPAAPYPDVGGDPTENPDPFIDCETYEVEAPFQSDDIVRLGDFVPFPGAIVEVPVRVTNEIAVEAFQFVIGYDPAVFTPFEQTPQDDTQNGIVFDGAYYDGYESQPRHFLSLRPDPDSGVFTVAFIPDLINVGHDLAPGFETEVFRVRGKVADDLAPGTPVRLEPIDDGSGPFGLRNELTVRGGESRYVTTLPDVIGVLAIVPDQIFFIRGDSNADAAIDSSDAIFTLGFLFLGGAEPLCLDAADANDDGRLDISDAVSTLAYLYVGQISTLPAPFPSAGGDPTPDGLDCAQGAL